VPASDRKFVVGVSAVVGLLVTMAVITEIAGVSTWKWALGVLALVLFVLAERQGPRQRNRRHPHPDHPSQPR